MGTQRAPLEQENKTVLKVIVIIVQHSILKELRKMNECITKDVGRKLKLIRNNENKNKDVLHVALYRNLASSFKLFNRKGRRRMEKSIAFYTDRKLKHRASY